MRIKVDTIKEHPKTLEAFVIKGITSVYLEKRHKKRHNEVPFILSYCNAIQLLYS